MVNKPKKWMRPLYYRRDGTPIVGDVMDVIAEWSKGLKDRIVVQEELANGYVVSTVFLGIDHNWTFAGPPLIFETMVYKSKEALDSQDCLRYSTEADAKSGHKRLVSLWGKVGCRI